MSRRDVIDAIKLWGALIALGFASCPLTGRAPIASYARASRIRMVSGNHNATIDIAEGQRDRATFRFCQREVEVISNGLLTRNYFLLLGPTPIPFIPIFLGSDRMEFEIDFRNLQGAQFSPRETTLNQIPPKNARYCSEDQNLVQTVPLRRRDCFFIRVDFPQNASELKLEIGGIIVDGTRLLPPPTVRLQAKTANK